MESAAYLLPQNSPFGSQVKFACVVHCCPLSHFNMWEQRCCLGEARCELEGDEAVRCELFLLFDGGLSVASRWLVGASFSWSSKVASCGASFSWTWALGCSTAAAITTWATWLVLDSGFVDVGVSASWLAFGLVAFFDGAFVEFRPFSGHPAPLTPTLLDGTVYTPHSCYVLLWRIPAWSLLRPGRRCRRNLHPALFFMELEHAPMACAAGARSA